MLRHERTAALRELDVEPHRDESRAPGKVTRTSKLPESAGSQPQVIAATSVVEPAAVIRRPGVDFAFRPDVHAAPIQLERMPGETPSVGRAQVDHVAGSGLSGGAMELPFLDKIQPAFGSHSLVSVRAFMDDRSASACRSLGAAAYTCGESIGFRGSPSLHTAAHEAAHVVQQRSGVDPAGAGDRWETHADRVADLVVAGRSAEPLLNQLGPSRGGGGRAVQLKKAKPLKREPIPGEVRRYVLQRDLAHYELVRGKWARLGDLKTGKNVEVDERRRRARAGGEFVPARSVSGDKASGPVRWVKLVELRAATKIADRLQPLPRLVCKDIRVSGRALIVIVWNLRAYQGKPAAQLIRRIVGDVRAKFSANNKKGPIKLDGFYVELNGTQYMPTQTLPRKLPQDLPLALPLISNSTCRELGFDFNNKGLRQLTGVGKRAVGDAALHTLLERRLDANLGAVRASRKLSSNARKLITDPKQAKAYRKAILLHAQAHGAAFAKLRRRLAGKWHDAKQRSRLTDLASLVAIVNEGALRLSSTRTWGVGGMPEAVLLEQIAHYYTYHPKTADRSWLAERGYRIVGNYDKKHDCQWTIFAPNEVGRRFGRSWVVSFRGTEGSKDVKADVGNLVVGQEQFVCNIGDIAKSLAVCKSNPVVTGHSLGGALAQLAACYLPQMVKKVVTFQSPGIDKASIKRLDDYNKNPKNAGRKIYSEHHLANDDVVIKYAGQGRTKGNIYEYQQQHLGISHKKFPVTASQRAATGNHARGGNTRMPDFKKNPAVYSTTSRRPQANHSLNGWIEAGRRRLANKHKRKIAELQFKQMQRTTRALNAGKGVAHVRREIARMNAAIARERKKYLRGWERLQKRRRSYFTWQLRRAKTKAEKRKWRRLLHQHDRTLNARRRKQDPHHGHRGDALRQAAKLEAAIKAWQRRQRSRKSSTKRPAGRVNTR